MVGELVVLQVEVVVDFDCGVQLESFRMMKCPENNMVVFVELENLMQREVVPAAVACWKYHDDNTEEHDSVHLQIVWKYCNLFR